MKDTFAQRASKAALSLALGFFTTLVAIVLIVETAPRILSQDARDPIETQRQLRVLQTVQSDLEADFDWDRQGNRVCIEGMPTTLFCMLANASIETIGHYQHDSDAMRVVRNVIHTRHPDRWTVHPIMDFNNHSETRRSDLKIVIDESVEWLESQLNDISEP